MAQLDFSEQVTVVVGTANKHFTVPKCFRTKTCDFFKACCNGQWKEATFKKVDLPDADTDAFAAYLQWLCTGEVVVAEDARDTVTSESPSEERDRVAREQYAPFIELAVLADMVGDTTCGNAVVDATIELLCRISAGPTWEEMRVVYDKLPTATGVRRAFVDWCARSLDVEELEEFRPTWVSYTDLTFDVMAKALKIARGEACEQPSAVNSCKYHEHNDKVPKCI
ncbi:hypothetical protein LTR85_005959 [Meristemomyces frigidus]|nr:hypothetical protein LTR85_005959 [Meristemomyces frigidus]